MANQYTTTEGGIIIPVVEPKPETQAKSAPAFRNGFPIKAGWLFSMCGDIYRQSSDTEFRMKALEALYTAVDPGGGGIQLPGYIESKEHCLRLLNELAVELVGGIPQGWEQYT